MRIPSRVRVARKSHRCDGVCGGMIAAGERYVEDTLAPDEEPMYLPTWLRGRVCVRCNPTRIRRLCER